MCLGVLFMAQHRAHPSMKNSSSTFRTTEAPQHTTWPTMCLGVLFMAQHHAHLSMKNSVSTFAALDAPERTTWPADRTRCQNTSSARRISACFLWDQDRAHLSMENSASRFCAPDAIECTMWPTDCDIPTHNKGGCSWPGSHSTITQMKCYENLTLLQIEFRIWLQSFKRKKDDQKRIVEALHKMIREGHLALEMTHSETSHTGRKRESTYKAITRQSLSN
jgi:hypothetical protein